MPAPAAAQECGIRRFGGTTSFSKPVETVGALQAMFTEKEDEIARMLSRAGWEGSAADLQAAIGRGATKQIISKGTRFEWVFRRVNGTPELMRDECYGGTEPVDAWAVDVESRGRRWHFVVPLVCGNVALIGSEALPVQQAQAKTEPQPAPRTAPPPAPAPPAPPSAPAPPPAAAPPPPQESAPAAVAEVPGPTWNFEVFAGYFFPEELDEDLTYGLRFGRRYTNKWGWLLAASWFDVADSQGFSGQKVDADLIHVDLSAASTRATEGSRSSLAPDLRAGTWTSLAPRKRSPTTSSRPMSASATSFSDRRDGRLGSSADSRPSTSSRTLGCAGTSSRVSAPRGQGQPTDLRGDHRFRLAVRQVATRSAACA